MSKRKLLIATSNRGKFEELKHFLNDLPFEFLSLNELSKKIVSPDEVEQTIEGNAILKAKYYAEKTGLLSLADDVGLYVDALNGWPGVKSARIAENDIARNQLVLSKMKGTKKREAEFKAALALFDPISKETHVTVGQTKGIILKKPVQKNKNGLGYDSIFYVKDKKKTFAEMSTTEKNGCSHRGKALISIKYYLQNAFSPKHIVCPVAIIVKDGKFLITKRNDPHRPEYHERWEFPGGGVEWGEQIYDNLKRETLEESGYKIEPVKQLQHIYIANQEYSTFSYQVYLIPHICKIIKSVPGRYNDAEVLDMKWIKPEIKEISKYKFVGENLALIKIILPELKQTIKDYNL
ncbi:MAG: RdgB/HAM1 family non-canonical purine NTP pyrophosphatase [bacterium]|nr:RdgB/HAM1 family non-canonical purine NTP pyrophosphatase [bacterium]